MNAKIIAKKIIAENTLYLEFKVAEPFIFKAGQFLNWELINPPFQDNKGSTRSFTIAYEPNNEGIIALATRLSESAFKRSLAKMDLGDELEISRPMGSFLLPSENSELIMLAGGIGITPFISQLKHIKNNDLHYKIKLLHFNQRQQTTPWLQELTDLSQTLPDFEYLPIMSNDPDWTGEQGLVSADLITKHNSNLTNPFYLVVGPPKMVEATLRELGNLEISQDQIITETFSGY